MRNCKHFVCNLLYIKEILNEGPGVDRKKIWKKNLEKNWNKFDLLVFVTPRDNFPYKNCVKNIKRILFRNILYLHSNVQYLHHLLVYSKPPSLPCIQYLYPLHVYTTSILSLYSIPPFSPCIQYLHHLILYNTSIISFYTIPPSPPYIQYLHPHLVYNTPILSLNTIHPSSLWIQYIHPLLVYNTSNTSFLTLIIYFWIRVVGTSSRIPLIPLMLLIRNYFSATSGSADNKVWVSFID